jgi:hypothetical protein
MLTLDLLPRARGGRASAGRASAHVRRHRADAHAPRPAPRQRPGPAALLRLRADQLAPRTPNQRGMTIMRSYATSEQLNSNQRSGTCCLR